MIDLMSSVSSQIQRAINEAIKSLAEDPNVDLKMP